MNTQHCIHNYKFAHKLHACIIAGVIAAIEADDSNSSATTSFNVQTFIHSNKLPPGVVSVSSAYELSDVFIDAELSQFGPKGKFIWIIS